MAGLHHIVVFTKGSYPGTSDSWPWLTAYSFPSVNKPSTSINHHTGHFVVCTSGSKLGTNYS